VPDIDTNFIHLGHPLILSGTDRTTAYDFAFDMSKSKLSAYKVDKLSHAARLELIKSVFSYIPVYYMSNIFSPKSLLLRSPLLFETSGGLGLERKLIQEAFV
jgi:hypothetical protein